MSFGCENSTTINKTIVSLQAKVAYDMYISKSQTDSLKFLFVSMNQVITQNAHFLRAKK